MLTPTTVTFVLRDLNTLLISGHGVHWPHDSCTIEFSGEHITEAVTKAVVFIERITCPAQPTEWKLINSTVCHWLQHRANPRDPFRDEFNYSSGKFWNFTVSIKEHSTCNSPEPLMNMLLSTTPIKPSSKDSCVSVWQRVGNWLAERL